jgi:hypothetical protein
MDEETLGLSSLGRGAAIERFDDALQRVLNNVIDPNTDLGARKIVLTVTIKPNDARDQCAVAISCGEKLGGSKPVGTTLFVGRGKDGAVALEHDPKQLQIELDEQRRQNAATVRPLQANR